MDRAEVLRTSFKAPKQKFKGCLFPSNETHAKPMPITFSTEIRKYILTNLTALFHLWFLWYWGIFFLASKKLAMSCALQKHSVSRGEKGAPTWHTWMFKSIGWHVASNTGWLVFVWISHRLALLSENKVTKNWWGLSPATQGILREILQFVNTIINIYLLAQSPFALFHPPGSWKCSSFQMFSFYHHYQ